MKSIPIAPHTGTRTRDTHQTEGERAEDPRRHSDGRTEFDLFGEPKQGEEDINPKTSTPDAPCRRQEPPRNPAQLPGNTAENAVDTLSTKPPPLRLQLSAHHHAQLLALAGIEPVEVVALLHLVRALDGETVGRQVGAHYQRFEDLIADLRRDLSVSTQGLLVALGRQTPQAARNWAERNLG
jgi:hypothetical protein